MEQESYTTMNDDERKRLRIRALWKKTARMAREQLFETDPMINVYLEDSPSERVERWRWINNDWVVDIATLKVSKEPFAQGSMRICWYAKKMSSRVTQRHIKENSKHASWLYQRNYVLKTYKKNKAKGGGDRLREMLEEDVITQAEAKAMAEKYNQKLRQLLNENKFDRRSPKPMKYKCIDMLEPCLVIFIDRPHQPAFFMEAYIAGNFQKWNDNAGYVSGLFDKQNTPIKDWRATPQAFSHFSFFFSQGERIIVDLQGVGDLFTDPQIHTFNGTGFGLGNGGLRGIALFFATHSCNRICKCMELPQVFRLGQLSDPRHGDENQLTLNSLDNIHLSLLATLEKALDDGGEHFDLAFSQHALSSNTCTSDNTAVIFAQIFSPSLYRALQTIISQFTTSSHKNSSSCFLARYVHKTLGFIFLHGNDPILHFTSASSALFHLAAAALGTEPTAQHFIKSIIHHSNAQNNETRHNFLPRDSSDDDTDEHDDLPQAKRPRRLANVATRAAAAAVLAFAVHNISSLLLR